LYRTTGTTAGLEKNILGIGTILLEYKRSSRETLVYSKVGISLHPCNTARILCKGSSSNKETQEAGIQEAEMLDCRHQLRSGI
jgi:hypothetical protein